MQPAFDRRGFFRRMSGREAPVSPPWTRGEAAFAAACDGCGACIQSCPQRILVAGAGGLPRVDFARGACTFCGACAGACDRGAFVAEAPDSPPWALRAFVADTCLEPRGVACRVCESACAEAALHFRPLPGARTQVIVVADRCTGCGGCVAVCPAGAIAVTATAPQANPEEMTT